MRDHTLRLRTIMLATMVGIGLALTMNGRATAGPSTEFSLSGLVNNPGVFALSDLQALPSTTQTVTYKSGSNTVTGTFTGVPLWTLLTSPNGGGGITTNPAVKNDILRDYVLATGSDSYRAVISLGEIHPNFGHQSDQVAYGVNGGSLGADGFARLVVPGDTAGGRYVSNLTSIQVLAAASQQSGTGGGTSTQFSLSGQINHPGTFTLGNLQALPSMTETVTYKAGQGTVTGTFTGVSLWTLLVNAGVITDPNVKNDILSKYLVATGTDGYQAVISLGEIHPNFGNQQDFVAYSVNGGSLGADGFARLVIPGDAAGGRYVSNIVSLEILNAGTAVPEPGTVVLLMTGLTGIALLRFHRGAYPL